MKGAIPWISVQWRVLLLLAVMTSAGFAQEVEWSDTPTGFASVPGEGLPRGTTGGAGGEVVTVDNQADLERYLQGDEPRVIRVVGTITVRPFGKEMRIGSNKTILGVGDNATISEGGFRIANQSNIILRNLTIRDSYVPGDDSNDFDGLQIDDSHHIWIDHCHFARTGDGLIDIRKGSDYITVSWCILSDHNKALGVGWTDRTDWHVTIHHTWFRNTVQRNPSFDQGMGHFYNNYLQNIASHGHNSRGHARVVVENSVYENVNRPFVFTGEGTLVARGNLMANSSGGAAPRGEGFDPRMFYDYELDPTDQVREIVRRSAGPQAAIGQ